MGCIARLGCLILLAVLAAAGWLTRDLWLPQQYRAHHTVAAAPASEWQTPTSAGAGRVQTALDKLGQPRGQAFQTVSASDLASYASHALLGRAGDAADSIAVRVSGETVAMRASVRVDALRGVAALGPLATMLHDREPVEFGGTVRVLKPGLAAFDVQDVKVRNIPIPRSMIPRLIKSLRRGTPPAGLPDNALTLPIPSYIGDIRVANGKVTLYKSVQ